MEAVVPPVSPTTSSSTSTPASPSASSPGGSSDSSASAAAAGVPEHNTPPRRRLVKASSIIAKRDGGSSGAGIGPPGFGLDRSLGTSPAAPIVVGSGPAGSALGVPSSIPTATNTFRERIGIRPTTKGDVQGDYPILPPHGPGGSSGPAKLGRPPFIPNPGIMGDIRALGRRPETTLQRRHEPPSTQKHAPEDLRIQQAKRACLLRAQTLGATGNYKNFDSPFGNYMVPVIPNQLFNKTPPSTTTSTSPSTATSTSPSSSTSPGVGR